MKTTEFKWHLMADECPKFGSGHYIVVGNRGAMYYACEFDAYSRGSLRCRFYVPNNRSPFLDAEKVKAWAEIPPFEVDG